MTNKFRVKKYEAEMLEILYADCQRKREDIGMTYEVVGKEEEQATKYSTGELLWEDDEKTIPLYRDKYEKVPKKELSDDDKDNIEAIDSIIEKLLKML